MLTDCHCHLDHLWFQDKLDEIIARAKKADVQYIITSGVNTKSNRRALEISRKYDIVKFSAGMYPIDLLGKSDEEGLPRQPEPIDMDEEFDFIKKHKNEIIAIGEVGIDAKYCRDLLKKQIENFEKIISFVEKLKKPIIIHSRKGEKEVLDLLESSKLKNVNLHCFMGNKKLIKRAEDLGYYFSIPPIIIKLQHFQMMAEMVNINQLLTETDSPWLSPNTGEMNEPAFVQETIKKLSEIKNITTEEVKKNIFMNFQKLFLKNH